MLSLTSYTLVRRKFCEIAVEEYLMRGENQQGVAGAGMLNGVNPKSLKNYSL